MSPILSNLIHDTLIIVIFFPATVARVVHIHFLFADSLCEERRIWVLRRWLPTVVSTHSLLNISVCRLILVGKHPSVWVCIRRPADNHGWNSQMPTHCGFETRECMGVPRGLKCKCEIDLCVSVWWDKGSVKRTRSEVHSPLSATNYGTSDLFIILPGFLT